MLRNWETGPALHQVRSYLQDVEVAEHNSQFDAPRDHVVEGETVAFAFLSHLE